MIVVCLMSGVTLCPHEDDRMERGGDETQLCDRSPRRKKHIFTARASVSEKKKIHFMLPPSFLSLIQRAPASGPGGVGALTSAGFSHSGEDSRHRRKDQPGRDTDAGQMTSFIPSDVSSAEQDREN